MNAAPSDNKRLCSIIVLLSQIATDSTEPSEKRQKETTQDEQQEKPFLYSITPSAPNPDDSATRSNPDEHDANGESNGKPLSTLSGTVRRLCEQIHDHPAVRTLASIRYLVIYWSR